MNSLTDIKTAILDFWDSYSNLPPNIKQQARKAYRLWANDNFHPSLHFKKVGNDSWFVE